MSLNTVIAKRTTKDHMLSNDLAPDTIIISPAMMKSFRLARQKYYIHLEEGKKNKGGSEMEMGARLITDDIDRIKLQQKDLIKAITMMETEQNDGIQLAEIKKGPSYVIKGNALKRKSGQTKKELATLEQDIAELEMKKKKMVWFISDKA